MSNQRVIPINTAVGVPTFTIFIEGKEIKSTYQVLSVFISREVNKIPSAKITIRDGDPSLEDFEVSNESDFIPGKTIKITGGYDTKEKSLFEGIIIKHGIKIKSQAGSVLSIECRDSAIKMTIGRHNKYFFQVTDSDVIGDIISTYGIATDVESTVVTHKELVQYYSTDWDFILSRADVNGKLMFVENNKVSVKKPNLSATPVLTLTYGATIMEFEAEMDARDQITAVKSSSWDYSKQQLVQEDGEGPSSELGNISASELARVIGLRAMEQKHTGSLVEQELKSWSDAAMLKSTLSKIRGRIKFLGNSDVTIGSMVAIQGVGNRFNGKAFVSAVRHDVDGGNWFTHVQFGVAPEWFAAREKIMDAPAAGLLPAIHGLQIGIVNKLENDPDGEDRIQVKLPVIDPEADGIWARIVSLDAGNKRGAYFMPEINDEVVVGFLNDDPRHAVVLGMVHSSKNVSPIKPTDDNHEKGFVTRSQIKLMFNDDKKSVTLLTPGNNQLAISDDEKSIVIKDQHGNSITLNENGVTIESAKDIVQKAKGKINLKATGDATMEGVNVSHKAQAKFKAEGSAGAELSTSAIAVVKGSMVQIN